MNKVGALQDNFFNEVTLNIQKINGVDLICFLDKNCEVIKEHKITDTQNYRNEIIGLIKTFNANFFHTYTLLNEYGLIIISKLSNIENIYMVIIAGENESVDLIKLLKICKEARSKSFLQATE